MKFSTSLFIAISALCFSATLAAPMFGFGAQTPANSQDATQVKEVKKLTFLQRKAKKVTDAAMGSVKAVGGMAIGSVKAAGNVANMAGDQLAKTSLGNAAIGSVAANSAAVAIKNNKHVKSAGNMAIGSVKAAGDMANNLAGKNAVAAIPLVQ
jgi:hypothetical protein